MMSSQATDAEQRRFARAVGADQADPLANAQVQRNIVKKGTRTVCLGQALRA